MYVWKFLIIFGFLLWDNAVEGIAHLNGTNSNSSFQSKEVHNSEDYPDGFADNLGKGAITNESAAKRLSKVESWPETLEEKNEYVTSEEKEEDIKIDNNGFLFLNTDYIPDPPANIKYELVELPSIDLYSKNCTIFNIDPNSQPSSEAFDVRGIIDDCEKECTSETMYQCTAFTYGGNGTYCVLHGTIDYGQVFPKAGSSYSITDVECLRNGSDFSSLQLCRFQELNGIYITPSNIAIPYREASVLNKDHCELLCNMHPFGSICTSFAFNPDIFAMGNSNCVLFSRNISIPIKFEKGEYNVYENPCFLSSYINSQKFY